MRLALIAALLLATNVSEAACPVELSVYRDRDGAAGIDFLPAEGAAVTNAFRMVFANGLVLDGMVMWSSGVERPIGMLQYKCPKGDLTGDELEACTIWQGIVYSVGSDGKPGLLPKVGVAPGALILTDVTNAIATSQALQGKLPDRLPFDVFELSGCQE